MLVRTKGRGHTIKVDPLGVKHKPNNLISQNKVLQNLMIDERWKEEWACCKGAQHSWRMIEPRSKHILQHTNVTMWCSVNTWKITDS
jgi:hypothetical protein